MIRHSHMIAMALLAGWFLAGASAAGPPGGTDQNPSPQDRSNKPARTTPNTPNKPVIRPADRVLFVGDDMTQQMFYTRAVATAMMAMMPEARLRFYNGGRDGATAGSALHEDIDDLLHLTQPTVVFLCFGLNDGRAQPTDQPVIELFKNELQQLIRKVESFGSVRQVVVVGPPAVQSGSNPRLDAMGYAQILEQVSAAAAELAASSDRRLYIDLYRHTKMMYDAANQAGINTMTQGGWLPSEQAHVVIASVILRGIGVTAAELDPLGWSPLRPVDMRQIRQVLAIPLRTPELMAAQLSRDLYEGLRRCDERFFRLWRLTRRSRSHDMTAPQHAALEEAWAQAQQIASYYASQVRSKRSQESASP